MERAAERAGAEPAVPGVKATADVASAVDRVLSLQRTAGNAAVCGMLRARRLARAPAMPGYSQGPYDSCGAASMVSALLIWDRESASNSALVHACDILLAETDTRTDKAAGTARPMILRIRGDAAKPGAVVSESDYQVLSAALALMFNGRSGMQTSDMHRLATALGFRPSGTEAATRSRRSCTPMP